jgi:hypothetical protein
MTLKERIKAPTPRLFRKLRTIGLICAATGGAILTAPISLPAVILSLAGYLTVAGGVVSAVSQITVDGEPSN